MRKFLLLIVAAFALLGIGLATAQGASAIAYSPTQNQTCTDTTNIFPNIDGDLCTQGSAEANGTGHVTRWYAPGTFTSYLVMTQATQFDVKAVFQGDGNLVVYGPGGVVYWASGTSGHPSSVFIEQADGNDVIEQVDGTGHTTGLIYWSAGYSNPGTNSIFAFGASWYWTGSHYTTPNCKGVDSIYETGAILPDGSAGNEFVELRAFSNGSFGYCHV